MKRGRGPRKRNLSPESEKRFQHEERENRITRDNFRAPPRLPAPMDLGQYVPDHLVFPCLVQPKMDGCFIRVAHVGYHSHVVSSGNIQKKEWYSFHALIEHYEVVPKGYMIEGEFYGDHKEDDSNVVPISFEEINSKFRSTKDPNGVYVGDPTFVVFAFDMIPIDPVQAVRPYNERYAMLKQTIATMKTEKKINVIRLMPMVRCHNLKDVDDVFKKYTTKGYEGIVIRDPKGIYESGWRSKLAMKRKPFHDEEYELIDFSVGDRCLKATCMHLSSMQLFGATWFLKPDEVKAYMKNKEGLIGKFVTVQYHLKTSTGIPRSGVIKGVRYSPTQKPEDGCPSSEPELDSESGSDDVPGSEDNML